MWTPSSHVFALALFPVNCIAKNEKLSGDLEMRLLVFTEKVLNSFHVKTAYVAQIATLVHCHISGLSLHSAKTKKK